MDQSLIRKIGEESATFTQLSINSLLANVWQTILLDSIADPICPTRAK